MHALYAVLRRDCRIKALGSHGFCGNYFVMNQLAKIDIRHSTCPHDCPSACALDIEVIDNSTIGRVRGSKLQTYTAGVVCAKVARYAERIHHPERLMYPQFRVGPKGSGKFARISWDAALDEVAEAFGVEEIGREELHERLDAALLVDADFGDASYCPSGPDMLQLITQTS